MTDEVQFVGTQRGPLRPALVLVICCASIFIVALDSSIVNVALPSIERELGASPQQQQWVVDGYTLTLASFLISSGVLADQGGRRRFFRRGLTIFGLGSLLCSIAPSSELLIAARVLQGFGGSMLNPVATAILTSVFTDPARRARALGAWSAVLGVALALGPIAGGVLIDTIGWRSIFWINVPVCALVVWATRYVPESFVQGRLEPVRGPGRRLDLRGQALLVTAMFTLVLLIIELSRRGFDSPVIWGLCAAFVVSATAAVSSMLHSAEPFLELRYFRNALFSLACLCGLATSCGQGVVVFSLSLYLQSFLGEPATVAGLHLVPVAVGTFVFSSISGRVMAKTGSGPLIFAGGLFTMAAGLLLLLVEPPTASTLLVATSLLGTGLGLSNAPTSALGVIGMGAHAGAASATVSTCRQLGTSIGVALAGALSSPATGHVEPSWAVVSVCGAIVAVSGVFVGVSSRRALRRSAIGKSST